MSDPAPPAATASQTVGPFFHLGMIGREPLERVQPLGGTARIELVIDVTDGDGKPVPDAVVELWQQPCESRRNPSGEELCAFGRLGTSSDGVCRFETARPPMHINVCLFARGLLRQLHTRIYFPGAPGLDADPVLALVPRERRQTLFAIPDGSQPERWRFHVRLQGRDETVFFDA